MSTVQLNDKTFVDDDEEREENLEVKEMVVRQFHGMSLLFPVLINGLSTLAVVDSAAQVTVLNEVMYKEMASPPLLIGEVRLKGIGDNGVLKAY